MRSHTLFSLLAFSLLLSVDSLRAGASNKNGNPFGNGSFFPNQGTFSAVVRSPSAVLYTTNSTNSNSITSGAFLGVVTVTTSTQPYTNTSTNGSGASAAPNSSGWATVYTPAFVAASVTYPSSQWSGPAFGVIASNQLAVTYSLQNTVNSVYGTNTNQTPQVLTTTNVNGAGQFTATLQNNYPNQGFNGQGYCSVQPALATNPGAGTPILNFSNTVSGWRLAQ